jgi:hypothetical protein
MKTERRVSVACMEDAPTQREGLGFWAGMMLGGVMGAIGVGSFVYWREQRAQDARLGGCVGGGGRFGRPRAEFHDLGYRFLPEGCTAAPPRAFNVMRQGESFLPPTPLLSPEPQPAGRRLRMIGVFANMRDLEGRYRCDVGIDGSPHLLAAYLDASDFAPGPCRDAFLAAIAPSATTTT